MICMTKRLLNLQLTRQEYDILKSKKIAKYRGKEGFVICNRKKGIARKLFGEETSNLDNKLRKLEKLYQLNDFENDIQIIRTISCEGKLCGYDMTTNEKLKHLGEGVSKKELIWYLDLIPQKLKQFHELGIVYGDTTDSNILINPEKHTVSFCDLDNMQVGEYAIDLFPTVLRPFCNEALLVDRKIDAYMYNLLLLNQLDSYYDGYQEILRQLENGYQPNYLEKRATPILQKMVNASSVNYYDGTYLNGYIKRRKR